MNPDTLEIAKDLSDLHPIIAVLIMVVLGLCTAVVILYRSKEEREKYIRENNISMVNVLEGIRQELVESKSDSRNTNLTINQSLSRIEAALSNLREKI